jgi:predicted nucleic acid-binding protein
MSGSNNYLLDTNIVLYLLNGDKILADIIDNKIPYVSYISEMELLSYKNISSAEEKKIKSFLDECFIIEMNQNIKAAAIRIRKTTGIKLPDSIIAASADYLNIPLLTADVEFNKLQSLNILQYKK